jgi:hypothetical protein
MDSEMRFDEGWFLGQLSRRRGMVWNLENWNPVVVCWTISGTGKLDWR